MEVEVRSFWCYFGSQWAYRIFQRIIVLWVWYATLAANIVLRLIVCFRVLCVLAYHLDRVTEFGP